MSASLIQLFRVTDEGFFGRKGLCVYRRLWHTVHKKLRLIPCQQPR